MNPRQNAAFTWVELLVSLAIVGILIALALPSTRGSGLSKGQMTQTLSNCKQLHLATQQMALDGLTTGDTNLGWPGDTGGTFTYWSRQLVPAYLTTNDFCKLLSAPGVIVPLGKIPETVSAGAVRVYAVSTNSPDTAVFLTSANFTNTPLGGTPLDKSTKPYGDKGFVVFRKGGDGAILLARQVGMTNIIGSYVPLLK
jgi:prepilin-type N-terminal cleavage/methylation domain-containing protein